MSKPRNWHAVNARFRKAGYHSGKKRPHLDERDDVEERKQLLDEPTRVSEEFAEYE